MLSNLEYFINKLEIKENECLLITGNVIKLLKYYKSLDKNFSIDMFIDLLMEKLGSKGTLLFQTFNWDFCTGKDYDIIKSKSQTGSLGTVALKKSEFKRTKHPIYSFAVAGYMQKKFLDCDNISAFGKNSPFELFKKFDTRMLIFNLPLQDSFTYVHYVEEKLNVEYRYLKSFSANYTNDKGIKKQLLYQMHVRDTEKGILTNITPLEKIFLDTKTMYKIKINNIEIKSINLLKSYYIIKNDILTNNAKNLYFVENN